MTKYDPYSYGQVNLGGAKKAPPTQPDDILFAEPAHAAPKKAPAADSSWELLDADVESLLPNAGIASGVTEFGADILGETFPADVESAPNAARPWLAAGARAPSGATPPVPTAGPSRSDGVFDRGSSRTAGKPVVSLPPPKPAKSGPAARRQPTPVLVRRRGSLASLLVPLTLFAAGGTASSWVYVMQQNPVLAGILAACTVVGAVFAWLLLRG